MNRKGRRGRRETRKLQKDFRRHPKLVFIDIMKEFLVNDFLLEEISVLEKRFMKCRIPYCQKWDKIEKSLITYRQKKKSQKLEQTRATQGCHITVIWLPYNIAMVAIAIFRWQRWQLYGSHMADNCHQCWQYGNQIDR